MLAKYTKWTNIWKKLTSLDSSQLEVFLGIFWDFFIFLNSNSNFKFGPVWNRPKPEPVRKTAVSGPVPVGFFNPGFERLLFGSVPTRPRSGRVSGVVGLDGGSIRFPFQYRACGRGVCVSYCNCNNNLFFRATVTIIFRRLEATKIWVLSSKLWRPVVLSYFFLLYKIDRLLILFSDVC